jgi:uncharacterized protein DUF998
MCTMASTKAPPIVSTKAAWLSVGTGVAYQALLAALIFLRPDLDPSWHSVSEWAEGPGGWVMSGTFIVCAISYFSLFTLLRTQIRNLTGQIGLSILLVCAFGVAGAGLFTTDPMPFHPPLSVRGTLHVACGTSQLLLFPFAALLLGRSLAQLPTGWARARRLLLWTSWLPLFAFLCFAVYTSLFVVPRGPHAYGPGVNIGWPPRLAFFAYTLWTLVVARIVVSEAHPVSNVDSAERVTARLPGRRAISQPQ